MALKAARVWVGSLLICTWAASAQAEECELNEDCPKGFSCEISATMGGCDAAPPCAPGSTCPDPEPCGEPIEVRTCQPAACATDADCGESMVCFKRVSSCSGGAALPACAPGEQCEMPAPDDDVCTPHEIALCVPRYWLPCQEDSDCGDGFSCEAGEECSCSGSGGFADAGSASSGDSDGAGFAPVPADAGTEQPAGDAAVGSKEPVCECHPTERKRCELKVQSCSSDQDCPSDFVCKTYADGGVSCGSDGADAACAAAPAQPEAMRCEPRYGLPTRGGTKGGSLDVPSYEEGGHPDAGVAAPQSPSDGDNTESAADSGSCSATNPRAGRGGTLFASFGFVLLALAARMRRKQR